MADTEAQAPEELTNEQQVKEESGDAVATSEEAPATTTVEEESDDEEIEYVCPAEFDEREEMCKMFVGGLDKETTDEEFKELFKDYGEIKDFLIIRKDNNKSERLFGFITFTKCDDLEECLLKRPHKYKEKELDVRRAVPRTSGAGGQDTLGHTKVKKLHVANVPAVFSTKTLKKYLKARHPTKYGAIEEINFVKVKDEEGKLGDKNKGFGFITVTTEDFADRLAIGESKFTLDGVSMRISKAKPKGAGGNRFQRNNQYQGGWNDWNYGPYGGGYGGYGGYDYSGGYGGYGGYNYGGGYGGGNYGSQGGRGRGGRFRPY